MIRFTPRGVTLRPQRVALAALALAAGMSGLSAQAAPALSFSSNAQMWGAIGTNYTSPLLGGSVQINLTGATDYQYYYAGSGTSANPLASATYTVQAGNGGQDPLYDIFTASGAYGFSYSGMAQAQGLHLRTQLSSSVVDQNGALLASAPNTWLNAQSYAQWSQGLYIAPTAAHAAGTYGAIVVGITLDGSFPALADPSVRNDASTQLNVGSSFTDTAGVQYSSNFSINAYANDTSWTGASTVYKKLLFQYGTVFNLNAYQYTWTYNSGSADFFNTGKISQIEIPFGAVLDSGAAQAGLGTNAQLYGTVFNSATADAQNTNWDFGNNGGGFTPQVPEPQTWLLMLAGLGAVVSLGRRRGAAQG